LIELVERGREHFDARAQGGGRNARPVAHVAAQAEVGAVSAHDQDTGIARRDAVDRGQQLLAHGEIDPVAACMIEGEAADRAGEFETNMGHGFS
jgi:hypothetical protein